MNERNKIRNKIKYDALFISVRDMINVLEGIGINVSEYSAIISDILDNCSYEEGGEKLKEIKSLLAKYEWCFAVSEFIDCVPGEFDENNINDVSAKAVECIKKINSANIERNREVNEFLEEFYDLIYLVIKEEVILDKSYLFDFVKSDDNFSIIIGDLVRSDINTIRLGKMGDVKLLHDQLDIKGYLDRDLIKIINDRDKLIDSDMHDFNVEFFKKNRDIEDLENNVNSLHNDFSSQRSYLIELKDRLFKLGLSLGLAGVLAISGVLCIIRSHRMMNDSRDINTSTWTQGDTEPEVNEDINSASDFYYYGDGIYLKECFPYSLDSDGVYVRRVDVYSYDINDYFQKLINVDFPLDGEFVETTYEFTHNLSAEDNYSGTVREVVVVESVDNGNFRNGLLLLFIYMACEVVTFRRIGNNLFGDKRFIDGLRNYKSMKKNYIQNKDEYDKKLAELIELVKANEDLRDRFNKFYDDFVSKYGETYEIKNIYDAINVVSYSKIKERKK